MKLLICLSFLIFCLDSAHACTVKVAELQGPELMKEMAAEYFDWYYEVDETSNEALVSLSCWIEDAAYRCRAISREGKMTYLSNRSHRIEWRKASDYRIWKHLIDKTVEGLGLCEERSLEN